MGGRRTRRVAGSRFPSIDRRARNHSPGERRYAGGRRFNRHSGGEVAMKPLLCVALLAMLAQAAVSSSPLQTPALPTQTASLEGTAVLQSSGQPLAKVYIDLRG